MLRFALVGTVEIAPGRMDEFLPLLMAHRARCLKDEPGTLQFEVLMPRDANTKVMLYEVYQNEAAHDAHSKGPSIARLREEAAGMIVMVSGTRGTLLE
jgi:(4S)-4-hydroxy-5-phosphonooxypentane-2,3-dione isomerase